MNIKEFFMKPGKWLAERVDFSNPDNLTVDKEMFDKLCDKCKEIIKQETKQNYELMFTLFFWIFFFGFLFLIISRLIGVFL